MNVGMLENFGQNYPEETDGSLDCISMAVTCAYNRRGTLLAAGCNDGRIVLWDFMTRGIAKVIIGHIHPISSLCWSRNGRLLVSASTDNTIVVMDVSSSDPVAKWRFPSHILRVQFNPRNDSQILVCLVKHAPVLLKVPTDGCDLHTNPAPEGSYTILPLDDESDLHITASFDRRGDYVYLGNSKGKIIVINVSSGSDLDIVASFRVSRTDTSIKQIEFAPKCKTVFLVSTGDRIIRVYDTAEVMTCGLNGEPEPIQKLQDLVNKTTWKRCCFSGGPEAEYVCAGSARNHALYIWERNVGTLVKILQGLKGEILLDVVWHPMRPIVASVSSGLIFIWSQAQVENWSAFAPDFKELDENVEYEERESEFDQEDEDRSPARIAQQEKEKDEDIEVEIEKVDPIPCYQSSDEEPSDGEGDELIYLPVAVEIEEPECVDIIGTNITISPTPGGTIDGIGKRGMMVIDVPLDVKDEDGNLISMSMSTSGDALKGFKDKGKGHRLSGKRGIDGVVSLGQKRKKKMDD